jgi:protein-S-isoprenylcysteine O-methyltransferase Ste14
MGHPPVNRKNVLGELQWITFTALALFVSAGRWDLPMLWAYFCVYIGSHLAIRFITFKRDPDLYKERKRPWPGALEWDRRLINAYQFIPFATWGTAGLDAGRLHWSDTVPLGAQIAGLVGLAASFGLVLWAMTTNTFYSRWVRIQTERGHQVVTAGPYRCVRHPGYLGSILSWVCGGVALGSWLAMVPVAVTVLLLMIRTAREDRILRKGLTGYAAYAGKVHYRLLAGLW